MPLLNLYMGKNTPERKDYILERLDVPVEEGNDGKQTFCAIHRNG